MLCLQPNDNALYLHDTVLLYAKLAEEVRSMGKNHSQGENLLSAATNKTYRGSGEAGSTYLKLHM